MFGGICMRLGKSVSLAVAMLASGTAFAGTPGWSISESSGQVSVVSTGLVKAAVRGGAVATGDFINTGRNGRAVLVRGEEYLVVSPNTRIRVADPAKSGGLTQIVEHFGNVIYKIKKMTMPHFAVETPFLAAVVKGTTFSVTVTEKGAAVQVTEGRVEVATRDGGASFMVLPGDIGSVSASAPATLNVQGRENRSISSPTPAAAAAAVSASVEADAPSPSPSMSTSIETPVTEGAVNLSSMSDGMVSGDSSMSAMTSMSSAPVREAQTQAAAPATPVVVEPVQVAMIDPVPVALPPTPADPVVALPPPPAVDPVLRPPAPAVDPVPAPLPPTPAPAVDPVPVALPPTPADPVVAPPPAPVVDPTPAPAVDPVPIPLPPTPAPVVADPVPVALPPTPADPLPTPLPPAVDPAPAPLPPAPAVDPVPAPLPPTPAVDPTPVPVTEPLPAPAPTAPPTNNGNGNGNGLSNNIGNNSGNGLNGNNANSGQSNNNQNGWNGQFNGVKDDN
jgi:hypothetical protein